MTVFTIFNLIASLVLNASTFVAMCFWTSFFGSSELETGTLSLLDMSVGVGVASHIEVWAVGAVCGPSLDP